MKFCTECGNELQEGLHFCTACGAKQEEPEQPVAVTTTSSQQRSVHQPQKKPISKKTKWFIGVIASVCIILFGAHQFLASYFDPMKDLKTMDQAISSDDANTFISLIHFNDAALLDEEGYFQYIKDFEWESVKNQFLQLVEGQKENNYQLNQLITSQYGDKLFTMKQDSVLLGLYTKYSFQAIPTKLMASTNIEGTEVIINDVANTLEDTEPNELVQIYPGDYTVNASAENIFGTFEYNEDLEVQHAEQANLDIEFSGETYPIDTNKMDAYLFLNGENTEKKLSEFDFLGPIPNDSDLEMHAEWKSPNGDNIKSDVLTLGETTDWYGLSFYFDESSVEDEPDTEVASSDFENNDPEKMVLNFRDAYESALNSKDFSLIEPYLEIESEAYEELRIYIGDLKNTDYHYDFEANEVLSVDSISDTKMEITTNEIFTFTNHLDEQIDYDRKKIYTLILSDDTYKITTIDYVETNRDN
ncbi:hypothetical protein CIL05_16820 [Virgibacillus profundi]|uniref:Zinc-ribbon domain-containing protein n=1 Tax=Virgibacillus profundi TaxID=2024555 RepID=A0A2A2I998_9BACI|nr:hypothetical protein [Virgibacillus profundi]PAV28299.1 hypothetical protein CIL05_16820 [Virgibacillus profundi]PXY54912.1 hypothetical protein CIT14_03165 [Virgibacillus profundi]